MESRDESVGDWDCTNFENYDFSEDTLATVVSAANQGIPTAKKELEKRLKLMESTFSEEKELSNQSPKNS